MLQEANDELEERIKDVQKELEESTEEMNKMTEEYTKLKVYIHDFFVSTRKGYVALATHGRVALILRMNGSDRM